ncbi:MAG: SHOCT domain-containing protein [Christensenellaceae bacterium]|nr:SHOCT domain-containing protein [Christensenellaceae bacterium]
MGIGGISYLIYDAVYFFDGLFITKILWYLAFAAMLVGTATIPFYISTQNNKTESEDDSMNVKLGHKYSFKNGQITVLEDRVLIDHSGARGAWTQGFAGEKTIPMNAIQTVQLREGTTFVRGYLQFGIAGEGGTSGGVGGAVGNENSVLLACGTDRGYETENANARAIKKYVEERIFERMNAPVGGNTIVQQTSAADELKKFKELLDLGIISQDEFDAKKKQLLGL